MEAVRTLIRWAGDDPTREGLLGTPDRVVRAYEEFFSGYEEDPVQLLHRTFEEISGYDEIVLLKDIRFESHCEHHMAPIIGKAHVAYLPNNRVVGISKLARLVEVYAKRLQIQEKMTAQVANTIDEVLRPKGVAVVIEAAHQCMTTRGVHKPGVSMVTSRMLGVFRTDATTRREVLAMIGTPAGGTAGTSSRTPGTSFPAAARAPAISRISSRSPAAPKLEPDLVVRPVVAIGDRVGQRDVRGRDHQQQLRLRTDSRIARDRSCCVRQWVGSPLLPSMLLRHGSLSRVCPPMRRRVRLDVERAGRGRAAVGRDQLGGAQRQRIERVDPDHIDDGAGRKARPHPLLRPGRGRRRIGAGGKHDQRQDDQAAAHRIPLGIPERCRTGAVDRRCGVARTAAAERES